MKPLISLFDRCLLRSGVTASTWPCREYVCAAGGELHADTASTARIHKAICVRIAISLQSFAMVWVGTSGYNYPEWKGTFYPKDLPQAKMLPYYAARFPTVEINYTFYRMPTEKLVSGWAAQTPSPYRLTLKAPRRITHDSRLKNCGPLVVPSAAWLAHLATSWARCSFSRRRTRKRMWRVRCVSGRPSARRPCRLRVPACFMVRRRSVRAASPPKSRSVYRRQREDVHAG